MPFPKNGGTIPTDLSRDRGWELVVSDGFDADSLVAIDGTWSGSASGATRSSVRRAARGRPGPGHSAC